MMTLSSTIASPLSAAYARTMTAKSVSLAPARLSDWQAQAPAKAQAPSATSGAAIAERAAEKAAEARPATLPDAMKSLSTAAVVNAAMNSVPAKLSLMSSIATASGAGTLSDADLAALQAEYAQLNQQVAGAVGAAAAGSQTATSSNPDDEQPTDAKQETNDDRRSTLTQSRTEIVQYVQRSPAEKLVPKSNDTVVPTGTAARSTPEVSIRTHELHVGTDSYEPVAVRQLQTQASRPAELGVVEHHATTQRVMVAQAAQIVQMTEVAQMAQISVRV